MTRCRRILSVVLLLALICSLLPAVSRRAEAATLVSTSSAPGTTAEEVNALFSARSEGQHPRILADADMFAKLRQQIQTDEYSRVLYARMYDYCVSQLSEPVSIYEIPDGLRLLSVSRTASARIIWLSMMYHLSGERRFAERAVAEMLAVSTFSDWNHKKHYLDVGEMAYGVGIGYDWLYHYMTEAQREAVRTALYNHAITTGMNHFVHNSTSNWNPWCMAGLAIASAAVYESYPTDCSTLLAKTVTSIQGSLALFTPLGAYPEAASYYRIGSEYSAIYFETLQSVLGTDFGLSDLPCVRESSKYLRAATGYVSTFNFGDCNEAILDGAMHHWYASRFNMPELSLYQMKYQSRNSELMDEPLALIWYNPDLVNSYSGENQQLDYLMLSDEYQSIASFRSFDADPNQIFAAIKSGYNSTSHADMDVGTFVMEAMGERWFLDLGLDNYNLFEYGKYSNGYKETIGRWTYYRKRTEGQNTLVINPGTRGGQDVDAKCQIVDYKSSYDGGYATVDMTDAYDNDGDGYNEVVTSAKRGLMLFDNRSRVLLRDELTCSAASQVYWFAHTQAEISISADGKTATLTQDGKTLLAQIAAPSNAVFTQMEAVALPTSPAPAQPADDPLQEKDRSAFRKLVIQLNNVTSTEISVVFTPVLEGTDTSKPLPDVTLAKMGTVLKDYNEQTTLNPNSEGIYEIYNVEQLCLLSDMVAGGNTFEGKTVKLMNDIDMGGRTFSPIGGGGSNYSFRGTFDGNYHCIKNLCIFRPDYDHVGFFGKGYAATIKNFGIESGVVFGKGKTGGIIGSTSNTTIENCYNKANVIACGSHAGGIVGEISYTSSITNCYNNADIKNYASVSGGIIGYIASKSNITVTNCYHVGNLTATSRCGLIGYYATSGTYLVGSVTVTNSYATTPLRADDIPDNPELATYTSCAQITAAELPGLAINLGDAFIYDCEWENDGYPVFSRQCNTTLPEDLTLSTEAELRLLSYMVNKGITDFAGKTVTLRNDIDLKSREWVPIGGNKPTAEGNENPKFRGTFDGGGYAVKNLRVSTNHFSVGFFGAINATVRNFGIKSGYVQGYQHVGGIVGVAMGKIENCYNRALVTGNNRVGGVAGLSHLTTFTNCYNTGEITGSSAVAGIVARLTKNAVGTTLTNCYNAGKISGSNSGGVVGTFDAALSEIAIQNCYTTDNVSLCGQTGGYVATGSATCTAAEMKTKTTQLGAAFADDTRIAQNDGFPLLNSGLYGTAAKELQPDDKGVYNIYTAEDLRSVAYMVNVLGNTFAGKTVKLHADIDLENKEWIPIGGNTLAESSARPYFGGTFDGNGHIITNLRITSGNLYIGLFGFASGATIKNVGLENGMVIGQEKIAGLVGSIRGASKVMNCYSMLNVTGQTSVGGIVGMIGGKNSSVQNCYNGGAVAAKHKTAGGIVGYIASDGGNTKIENCYNLGIQSPGIVGDVNAALTDAEMKNCYTIDTVELADSPRSIIVTDCAKVDAVTLRTYDTVLGSAFQQDYLAQNRIFPVLAWQNGDAPTTLTQVNSVYEIDTANELRLLSYYVRKGNDFKGKQIVLTADIDLEGKQWLSIGGYLESKSYLFRGSFDGRGHRIFNINACEMDTGFTGLFGVASVGVIENVGIESGIIVGKDKVAGIAGNLTGGATIKNCYSKATLYATNHVGGMAGMINSNGCSVINCYNLGAIYARKTITQAAGIVGYVASNTKNILVENCYDVGSYNTIFCDLNATSANIIIRDCFGVGGVQFVRAGTTYALEGNTAQISAAALKANPSFLGEGYAADHLMVNQGYPVLTWEESAEHNTDPQQVTPPTFTTEGATADVYCKDCGQLVCAGETLEVLDKALFFDFDNSTRAQERYQNFVYNMENFDVEGAWRGRTQGLANGSQSLNTAAGTLTVMPGKTGYSSIYADSVNMELNYDPDYADYFQIRFKMNGFSGTTPKATIHFYYSTDNSYASATPVKFDAAYLNNDTYITVTGEIQEEIRKLEEINRVIIHFSGFDKPEDLNGSVTIDYAYVGPYAGLPSQNSLYFDFGNTPEDQARYDTKTYGYTQYDDPAAKNWYYTTKTVDTMTVDNAAGLLTVKGFGKIDDKEWPAIYLDPYDRANKNTNLLHFDPSQAEYLQVRFKMDNFKTGDHLAEDSNGKETTNAVQAYLKVQFSADGSTGLTNGTSDFTGHRPYLDADEWFVATVPLNSAFKSAKEIQRFRVFFGGIESISEDQQGILTVDYIFVGARKDLPTPAYTVTFVDESGKTLATQLVNRGETATYTGKTPAKAYDGEYHYSFAGWSESLENVTSDMTVKVQFTATRHSLSYTSVDKESHKESCSCGYTATTAHAWDKGSITKAATCTEAGEMTFACENCSATKKESIDALGHSYNAVSVPPTCTDHGYTVYICTCGHSYMSDEVEALGHSYNDGVVTTQPTCAAEGVKTFTCSACDHSYTQPVPATGHKEETVKGYAATCTEPGKTDGKKCSICGEITVAQTTIPATGHVNTSTNTTDATCTENGSVVVTCACGEVVSTEVVAALGHSYVYIYNGDNHIVSCANACTYVTTEPHAYVDGVCVCGAEEVTGPVVDHNISFGSQLVLASDLTMTFRMKPEQLTNYDLSTMYIVVERDIYGTDGTMTVDTQILTEYTTGNRLVFTYSGIAAAQMNDEIRAVLHIQDKNGKEYVSDVFVTSVTSYLDLLIASSTNDAKLMTLILDMLNYGTAAQMYFKRHADAPANMAYESFITYADCASVDLNKALENLKSTSSNEGATGTMSIGLDLGTRIGIQYKVALPEGMNAADAVLVIKDANGNQLESIDLSTGTMDSKGRYVVNFYGLASRQIRDVVTATAYVNGKPVTATYTYNISTYAYEVANAAGMPENLINLTRLMVIYGDSAAAYFGQN